MVPHSRSLAAILLLGCASLASAQSVGLPTPRLLTTTPMGGKAGTTVEVAISGEYLEDVEGLTFSDPRITAKPVTADRFAVTVAGDCPVGLYEARVMTRLGISTSRIFAVGTLAEVVATKPNRALADALPLPLNCVCNASTADRSIDYYTFAAKQGQRLVIDCAARGIDSKLNASVSVGDAAGRDLLVERRGGALDFTVPKDGTYSIKVHDLTFKGGPAYYYRLGLWEQPKGTAIVRQPGTRAVNSFSWPPPGLPEQARSSEVEPNDPTRPQRVSLPCDIAGRFYPAADVDVYEFAAKKGEEWWIEVASERLGLPTDPAVLVQRVTPGGLADVLELADVPSPVKVSSNGYAYDGPPYNAGTADVLGKLTIKEDGLYRIQLADQFGGTRSEPTHGYRLVVRKATPDFALVAWALHMELRNGDRNALSKPLALRGGATMALEVVAFRRDGFDGDIELSMDGLPAGVVAHGLKIPAGKSHGMLLLTAKNDAPRGYTNARFVGKATIAGKDVVRPCRLASMAWPIPDSWGEIPSPRLLADVPVSVAGLELAPLTLAAKTPLVEATVGQKLTVPIVHKRTREFSGDRIEMKVVGAVFDRAPRFELPTQADGSQVTFDLKALNVPPGDYRVSFVGPGVVKYRHRPEMVASMEAEVKKAAGDAKKVMQQKLAQAQSQAQPRDIADIVVCEPFTIRVKPAEKK